MTSMTSQLGLSLQIQESRNFFTRKSVSYRDSVFQLPEVPKMLQPNSLFRIVWPMWLDPCSVLILTGASVRSPTELLLLWPTGTLEPQVFQGHLIRVLFHHNVDFREFLKILTILQIWVGLKFARKKFPRLCHDTFFHCDVVRVLPSLIFSPKYIFCYNDC